MTHSVEIDCIKGIAILMVIVFHSLISYSLYIGSIFHIEQAVPLFLTVSAYLAFSKMKQKRLYTPVITKSNVVKLVKRIFVPFVIFQMIILFIILLKKDFNLLSFILSGGYGMGSYYPWLYLQFWLLLPFFYLLLTTNRKSWLFIIICSFALELLFTIIATLIPARISDSMWRLFVGRYLFIYYIAYILVNDKFKIKNKYLVLVFFAVLFCIIHRYQLVDLRPWFYTTKSFAWNGVHWPMYFYSGFVFFILYKYVRLFPPFLKNKLQWLGVYSWEIFLSQMLYFTIFQMDDMPTSNKLVKLFLFLFFAILFSSIVGRFYVGFVHIIGLKKE